MFEVRLCCIIWSWWKLISIWMMTPCVIKYMMNINLLRISKNIDVIFHQPHVYRQLLEVLNANTSYGHVFSHLKNCLITINLHVVDPKVDLKSFLSFSIDGVENLVWFWFLVFFFLGFLGCSFYIGLDIFFFWFKFFQNSFHRSWYGSYAIYRLWHI